MFRQYITSTPMTTAAADEYFENINGQKFGGQDVSFLATLRALVGDRISEGDSIYLKFTTSDYSKSTIDGNSPGRVISAIADKVNGLYEGGNIILHSFEGSQESSEASMKLIEENFTRVCEGFQSLDKVHDFYLRSFPVRCFLNPDLKTVILFVDHLDIKKLHYLQVSILAFLPWYFDPSKGVSEDEMALLYSLRETSSDKYKQYIAKCAAKYDFRSGHIRRQLAGFETRFLRMEYDRVKERIASCDRDIDNLRQRMTEVLNNRDEYCIRSLGLQAKISEDAKQDSEIMEYFLCNKNVILDSVGDREMRFFAKGYIEYFDREIAARCIDNPTSYVWPHRAAVHNGISKEGMAKLLKEIFVSETPRLHIRVFAKFNVVLGQDVRARACDTSNPEFEGYMPNPHLHYYGCFGNYQRILNQLVGSNDYIGVIEQCIASCNTLNWSDSTVMDKFVRIMWGDSEISSSCIELPDGTVVDTVGAIKWLEEQEADEHEEEETEA